jgi:CCR4-NOT transcriptional complex subunit CAF120
MSRSLSISFFKGNHSTDPHQPGSPFPQLVTQSDPQLPPLSFRELSEAHTYKIYHSGSLYRRIERLPDGSKPKKDEGSTKIWAQLNGTTLSMWNMKGCQKASKQGKEVPPSHINITEAVSYSFAVLFCFISF